MPVMCGVVGCPEPTSGSLAAVPQTIDHVTDVREVGQQMLAHVRRCQAKVLP